MTGMHRTISSRGRAPSCSPSDCGTTNSRTIGDDGLIHLVEAAATALTELVGDSGASLVEEWAKKDMTAANSSSRVPLPTTAGAGSNGMDSSVQDVVSVSSARSNGKNSRPPAMISDDDDAASESSSSSSSNSPSGSLTLAATTTTTTSPVLEKTRSAPAATSDTTSSLSIGASAAVAAASSSASQSESPKLSKEKISSSSSNNSLSQSFLPSSPSSNTTSFRGIFPQRLMAILSDRSFSDVVSWSPHGRSFVVIKTDEFTERVLPQFMSPQQQTTDQQQSPQQPPAAAKYPSFTRKLNRWGFRLVSRGPDAGAFHHHLFQRDQPDLCLQMVCQKSSSSSRKGDDDYNKKQQKKTERHRQSKKKKKRQLVVDVTPNTYTSCNLETDNDIQLQEKDNKKRGLAIPRTTLPPKKRRPPHMTMDYDLSSTTANTLSGVSTDTVPSLDTSQSSSFAPGQPKTYTEYSASASHCMNHSLFTSSTSSHHLSSLTPQVPSSNSSMSSLSDGISANPASNDNSSPQVTTIHAGPNVSFPTHNAVFQPSVNYFNFIHSTKQTVDTNYAGTVANGVAPVLSSLLHANPGVSITQQQNSSQQLSPNNAVVSSALQNIMPPATTTHQFLLHSPAPTVNTQEEEEEQRPPPSFSLNQPSQNTSSTKPKEDSSPNDDITTAVSTSQTNQVAIEVGTKPGEEQERRRLIHAQKELYRAFLSALMA